MSGGVEDILDRLDGVEQRPRRLDRDARRAMAAVLIVATVSTGLAIAARGTESVPAETASASPASTDLLGAFERLSIDPAVESSELSDSPSPPATQEDLDGYESIEAIAPGRRT